MASVLHLYKGDDPSLALAAIARAQAAGDQVSVALLHGAVLSKLPSGVRVHRVPDDLGWDALLETIFASDQVVAW